MTSDEDESRTMSAYDINIARSCAESLYMTRTVAAVDAVAGSAVADHRAERWAAERSRREASASDRIEYDQHGKGVKVVGFFSGPAAPQCEKAPKRRRPESNPQTFQM